MSQLNTFDIAAVHRAWSRFCDAGDAGYLRGLPPTVSASWQRSFALGVDPGLKRFPGDGSEPRWTAEEAALLRVVKGAVAPFEQELRESGSLFAVVARSGRIIYRDGSPQVLRAADSIGSVPGATTLESAAGTNSAGTSLYLTEITRVERWAHFCEAFWSWSDIGVPLIHPLTRALLGMVDLGLPHDLITPTVVLVAKTVAASIERAVLQQDGAALQTLLKSWSSRTMRADSAQLVIDRHGTILCADEAAMRLFARSGGVPSASTISEVPALVGIADALASGTTSAYPITLDAAELTVHAEPMRHGDELAGVMVRVERLHRSVPSCKRRPTYRFEDSIGDSTSLRRVVRLAKRLAPLELPVLIHGETGTGKELLAQAIHAASPRAGGPFVAINCGAIAPELIASELFGYEKGAFTGANRAGQRGKFEQAHGGTLFLDEFTETSAIFQVSLLRAIQDQAVVPVGADHARPVDVRILSATNRIPEQAIASGVLRRDLFYRLNGAILTLPPLRERREDIPALIRHFCAQVGRAIEFAPAALDALMAHDWPGNLRELHAVVRSAALLAEGDMIELDDLPEKLRADALTQVNDSVHEGGLQLLEAERQAIVRAMTACQGNVRRAALALGMGRSTLYRKLDEFHLTRNSSWT